MLFARFPWTLIPDRKSRYRCPRPVVPLHFRASAETTKVDQLKSCQQESCPTAVAFRGVTCEALHEVVTDRDRHDALARRGLQRAATFSGRRTAELRMVAFRVGAATASRPHDMSVTDSTRCAVRSCIKDGCSGPRLDF